MYASSSCHWCDEHRDAPVHDRDAEGQDAHGWTCAHCGRNWRGHVPNGAGRSICEPVAAR